MAEAKTRLDWAQLASLRLRARALADGIYYGVHPSPRRGVGVEFGGHRNYVPGDDLRWLDRHALMRHGRLLVREFETETERNVYLVLDTTLSMDFAGTDATPTKLAYATLLAAALARIAISGGDRVSLQFLSGPRPSLGLVGGVQGFERIADALEGLQADSDASDDPEQVKRSVLRVGQAAARGSVIVLFSDLLDLPQDSPELFSSLGSRNRIPISVQILDPVEATFPLEGPVRLKALEGDFVVETDASAAKARYLQRLAELGETWERALLKGGGRFLRLTTDEDPFMTIHRILSAVRGSPP